jgi:tetratricopeptide (TPR) repeat protein
MRSTRSLGWIAGVAALAVLVSPAVGAAQEKSAAGKVPVTTTSDEARQLYLKGRDLQEKLRGTDANRFFKDALVKDKEFALAHFALATSSGTAKEFFDSIKQAVAYAPKASEAERHIILGFDAGVRGDPAAQADHLKKLVAAFPNDERAHNQMGAYYFGRQEYAQAVEAYRKATAINPSFSQPYNQMGYAYRFLEKYPEAEAAFKKYIELIPNDPNPYDSYAELLMKTGRFDESIANYQKALKQDANFIASHIGIGNDYVFMGQGAKAREAFAKITAVARNDGERRTAHLWTATSYLHEGATDKALAELGKMAEIAKAGGDTPALSGDLNQMGDILREAGRHDDALARYKEAVDTMEKADVPADVKEGVRRNFVFEEGRVALAKKDLATAKAKGDAYAKQVAAKSIPFEVRQQHELAGLIAIEEKRFGDAVTSLQQSNQQDPRIVYLTALALQGKGEAAKARVTAGKAALFNGLNFNYGFVREKAKKLTTG